MIERFKMTERKKKKLISELYQSLFESYPDCLEDLKKQFDIIEKGGEPTSIIGQWIKDDVMNFVKGNR